MDESDMYDNGRRAFNEPSRETDEPMEENENDVEATRRMDRCRRRIQRRSSCRCAPRSRRRRRRKVLSQNPFIIFYLELYFKNPGKRVTEVAREAGKIWSSMSNEDRKKYIRLAEKERIRRCRLIRRRGAR